MDGSFELTDIGPPLVMPHSGWAGMGPFHMTAGPVPVGHGSRSAGKQAPSVPWRPMAPIGAYLTPGMTAQATNHVMGVWKWGPKAALGLSHSMALWGERRGTDTLIDNPPRKAPICLDFSLYVKSINIPEFPHARWVDAGNGWVIISPTCELAVMPVDLQSMTWSHFQGLAIQHLGHEAPMARLLGGAHNNGALLWQAFILGNVQFSQKNKTVIRGPRSFESAKESIDGNQASKNDGLAKAPAPMRPRIRPTKSKLRLAPHNEQQLTEALPAKRGLVPEENGSAQAMDKSKMAISNHVGEGETGPSDRPAKHAKKAKTPVAHDTDNIHEVICGPLAVQQPATPPANSHSGVFRVPLGPESPQLEAVDMETYLMVSHIKPTDQATRRRSRTHGIIHWTFFRETSEAKLLELGFTLGIARLLCEGVPRLEAYVTERSVPL
ncbi:hypothetical protein PGT21_005843 [Puccinia graminis f. sp. tritici]|uniref:Uncharacterized protein n=1 Tax=Puccinia graminis f. sp. tritici TaxID=56615 RepID=A0A5B0MKG6_PUCGR|nr:hypothetical protein PGT21_005843 [Puccinia graminis f. sp. tritici]